MKNSDEIVGVIRKQAELTGEQGSDDLRTNVGVETIETEQNSAELESSVANTKARDAKTKDEVKEVGGPKGLEPTRYGDWESKGRCYDF